MAIDMSLKIGDVVFIAAPMPYLKTSDPMPMLRPPDLVSIEEPGMVVGLRPKEVAEVRFRRGTFLIPFDRLGKKDAQEEEKS